MLTVAREALEEALAGTPRSRSWTDEPWLLRPGASFVTLRKDGALRGCIGSLEARWPLVDDLRHNAVAAALRDPRFPPVEPAELGHLILEVTLLDPPEPMRTTSEADALARLRPGVDGVVLRFRRHHATFLPQVWDSLSEPADFLAHLKRKAGLPSDFWHPDLELERYTVRKWTEEQPVKS